MDNYFGEDENGKIIELGKDEPLACPVECGVMRKADCHINCHDCGQFLKRELWVAKDHPWKKHGLCSSCADNYDYYPEH